MLSHVEALASLHCQQTSGRKKRGGFRCEIIVVAFMGEASELGARGKHAVAGEIAHQYGGD